MDVGREGGCTEPGPAGARCEKRHGAEAEVVGPQEMPKGALPRRLSCGEHASSIYARVRGGTLGPACLNVRRNVLLKRKAPEAVRRRVARELAPFSSLR